MNNVNNKILVLKGQSQYDVLRVFGDNMIGAFEKLGRTVDVIDFQKSDYNADLIDAIIYQERYHYQFVFAFNAIYIDYKLKNKEYLFDSYGTVYYGFLVDEPLFQHRRLVSERKNDIISCVDKNHIDYIEKYYMNIKKVVFMPHATTRSENSYTDIMDREIDVAFFGSYTSSEIIKNEFNSYSSGIKHVMEEIANYMIRDSTKTLESSLDDYIKLNNLNLDNNQFRNLMVAMNCVDRYVRSYFREKIINVLIENNIKVHVYGNGWQSFESNGIGNLVIHDQLDYGEVLATMSRTKIVLNILPSFKYGSHERIFSSMSEGAVCVTNSNQYIKDNFEDKKNIIVYSLDQLSELPSIVKNILDDSITSNFIAKEGNQKVLSEDLWINRAEEILKQIEYYNQN